MSKPLGPYTPIVRAGDFLYVSGQVGLVDGALVDGGVEVELEQALSNLSGLLASENASMSDVVKTTIFMIDMGDYVRVNEIYIAAFGDHRPARSAVAVSALPAGAAIEVEAIAHVPS